jgi:hypothetical protein
MRQLLLSIIICILLNVPCQSQDIAAKANQFISLLNSDQQSKSVFPFDIWERTNFAFVPRDDRKGISMNELNAAQKQSVIDLLKTSLSEETVKKVNDIMQLEILLKELENRGADDHFRDPGKYFITIFGIPAANTIWGWRFEGHHISFNFSNNKNELIAGTPGFLGSNPGVVLNGPQKGKEILKDETAQGFALLKALSTEELKKAVISTDAPAEIITGNSRKAMIDHPEGIRYAEMKPASQQLFLALINVYVHRYTKLFAETMLKDIQKAGLKNLWFTWAGDTKHTPGKPYYYRIQGPTIIIEYDNTQNNANHVHTVVRDLLNDFGGDQLLEHYKSGH